LPSEHSPDFTLRWLGSADYADDQVALSSAPCRAAVALGFFRTAANPCHQAIIKAPPRTDILVCLVHVSTQHQIRIWSSAPQIDHFLTSAGSIDILDGSLHIHRSSLFVHVEILN
jgi:hypothetical protein